MSSSLSEKPVKTVPYGSVSVHADRLIGFLRTRRGSDTPILFRYGGVCYRAGVDTSHRSEPFYLDEDRFPSVFAFCAGAAIEGGCLLPDVKDTLEILSVCGGDPAPYFPETDKKEG